MLTEMVFQMGLAGVQAFHNTLAAMARGDFDAAADGMLASKWHSQTPKRAEQLAEIMRVGQ